MDCTGNDGRMYCVHRNMDESSCLVITFISQTRLLAPFDKSFREVEEQTVWKRA